MRQDAYSIWTCAAILVRVKMSKNTQADKSETSRSRAGVYREHRVYNASRVFDDRKAAKNRTLPISIMIKPDHPSVNMLACKQRNIRNRDQIYMVTIVFCFRARGVVSFIAEII